MDGKRAGALYCKQSCRVAAFRAVPCTYCGQPATSRDHVVPRVFRASLDGLNGVDYDRRLPDTVPACRECNSVLGSRLFPTVVAKRHAMHAALLTRYAKLLVAPNWTQAELDELGPGMRSSVIAMIDAKEHIRERLRWSWNGPGVETAVERRHRLAGQPGVGGTGANHQKEP
jgi:hypothetical protein